MMEASGSGGTYTGSLIIHPLAEGQDDGQYTCSVIVSGGISVLEATGSDSTTIDVTGKSFIPYYTQHREHLMTFCMPCVQHTYVQALPCFVCVYLCSIMCMYI